MGRRPKFDWEAIKALYIAGQTARELAIAFGASHEAIEKQSARGGWGALRKHAKAMTTPLKLNPPTRENSRSVPAMAEPVGFVSESQKSAVAVTSDIAFNRALKIKSSDNFRERVIKQADKALDALERANVSNIFETDRFAEALTKVERVGARAYGYDHEGDRPVINIGILGSGSEYDPV